MSGLDPALVAAAAGWTLILGFALHQVARNVGHWLLACLVCSGLYVILALRLESGPPPALLVDSLRWGLFGAALFSFFRYRRARGRGDKA